MLKITILFFIGFMIGLIFLITTFITRKHMPQGLKVLMTFFGLLLVVICGPMALCCGYFVAEWRN